MTLIEILTIYIVIVAPFSLYYSLENWKKYIAGKNRELMIEIIENYKAIKFISILLVFLMTLLFLPLILYLEIVEKITNYKNKKETRKEK